MLKFNSDSIVVGEIKELLASFNLTKYRIFTGAADEKIIRTIPRNNTTIKGSIIHSHAKGISEDIPCFPDNMNYSYYIKGNEIYKYVNEPIDGNENWVWRTTGKQFIYNKYDRNHTKKLIIKNAIYDSDTHEYLGDYLRFKRDYDKIDMMQLYNCFSNRLCDSLTYSFKITVGADSESQKEVSITFDTTDTGYKILMIPVKLFKKYTIAIDSMMGYEMFCGLYDNYFYSNYASTKALAVATYEKVGISKFNQPIIYTKLSNLSEETVSSWEIAHSEEALKLFIKLPASNTSTVTILEGDYRNRNDKNHSIIGLDDSSRDYSNINLISQPQLLMYNTGVSYPMSDRLIEFLTGNMITPEDQMPDNIRRVQAVVTDNLSYLAEGQDYFGINNAFWEDIIKVGTYEYMYTNTHVPDSVKYDITGYIDKDTEKYFNVNNSMTNKTLTNINLYSDIYSVTRANKEK